MTSATIQGVSARDDARLSSETNQGLYRVIAEIERDRGLVGALSTRDRTEGLQAAQQILTLISDAIGQLGLASDGRIDADDVRAINAHIRGDAGRLQQWQDAHGSDAATGSQESGTRLLIGEGATRQWQGLDLLDTVADGLFTIGGPLQGERLAGGATLTEVGRWLTSLLNTAADSGTGLDLLVDMLAADTGLATTGAGVDLNSLASATNATNRALADAIAALDLLADGVITADEVTALADSLATTAPPTSPGTAPATPATAQAAVDGSLMMIQLAGDGPADQQLAALVDPALYRVVHSFQSMAGMVMIDIAQGQIGAVARALEAAGDAVTFWERDRAVAVPSLAGPGAAAASGDPLAPVQYALERTGAPAAWASSRGDGMVVAVLDTGILSTHEDLAANLWRNTGETAGDGIDNDGNGFADDLWGWDFTDGDADPTDLHGHGTHVAGIVAATADNGRGIAGMAPGAQVMAIRVLDHQGVGTLADVARGIDYAVANGAQILNASLGAYGGSAVLEAALAASRAAGRLFVAAAGNDGLDEASWPARYSATNDSVLSVAATDASDRYAWFSNTSASGTTVQLAAPGVGITSTWIDGGYASLSGTSMAAPMVAGAAALVWAAQPHWTYDQVIQALLATATPLTGSDRTTATNGRLNVAAAIAYDPDADSGATSRLFGRALVDDVIAQLQQLSRGVISGDRQEVADLLTLLMGGPQATGTGLDLLSQAVVLDQSLMASTAPGALVDALLATGGLARALDEVLAETGLAADGDFTIADARALDAAIAGDARRKAQWAELADLAAGDSLGRILPQQGTVTWRGQGVLDVIVPSLFQLGNGTQGGWLLNADGIAYTSLGAIASWVSQLYLDAAIIYGSDSVDHLHGNKAGERFLAGAGDDGIAAAGGDDLLDGGAGNDSLRGQGGADVLTGGAGSDRFVGVAAHLDGDRITDLAHGDQIILELTQSGQGAAAAIRYDQARGVILIDQDGDGRSDAAIASDVDLTQAAFTTEVWSEFVAFTISTPQTVVGTSAADTLRGGAADDSLDGGDGHDVLIGGAGRDRLIGGAGQDVARGTLADINGDRLVDFGDGDQISVTGLASATADRAILAWDATRRQLTLDANGDGIIDARIDSDRDLSSSHLIRGEVVSGLGMVSWTVEEVRALNGTPWNDILRPNTAREWITTGNGFDTVSGSLATLNGDRLMDFGSSDKITLSGLASGESSKVRLGWDAAARQITIDQNGDGTVDARIDSAVDLTGGGFWMSDGWGSAVTFSFQAGATLTGTSWNDTFRSGHGQDTIITRGGTDTLMGTSAQLDGDRITDFAGALRIQLNGLSATTVNTAELGWDAARGRLTVDLEGDGRAEATIASDVDLSGAAISRASTTAWAGQVVFAIEGSRTLIGGSWNDSLYGGAAADRLDGAGGNDLLVGGAGRDVLTGGWGLDRFSGTAADLNGDRITDLAEGDAIQLSPGAGTTISRATLAWDEVRGALALDADGNGTADAWIHSDVDLEGGRFTTSTLFGIATFTYDAP